MITRSNFQSSYTMPTVNRYFTMFSCEHFNIHKGVSISTGRIPSNQSIELYKYSYKLITICFQFDRFEFNKSVSNFIATTKVEFVENLMLWKNCIIPH